MNFTLQSTQLFAIGLFVFGLIGFLQGWRRALVVLVFVLVAIVFLLLGGGNVIAEIFFVRIPQTIYVLTGGAIGPKSASPPSANQVLISKLITLGLALILGFSFAGRGFKPTDASVGPFKYKIDGPLSSNFVGIIPGMVTGYALMSYLNQLFAANPTVSLGISSVNTNSVGSYIVVIVIVAIVALVIGLMTRFGQ
ncbi:MAG TPA: hypothetical protein VIX20_06695 [Ktedonobacteraceae bacterium]